MIRDFQGFLGRLESLVVGLLCLQEFPCQLIKLLFEQVVSVVSILLVGKVGFCILPERDLGLPEGHLFLHGGFELFLELLHLSHVPLTELFQLF